jgi:shikimate dehydrogenase
VTRHDELAGAAGAVNTIVRIEAGFFGSNTDGLGLVRDLRRLGVTLRAARVLMLGAGGAVRGVLGPMLGESPRSILIANRTVARAEALVARFEDPRLGTVAIDALTGEFDLVVNGTSAGLGGASPGIDERLARGAFCYDMAYGAAAAPFFGWADRGAAIGRADGLGMLVEQAAEAFWLWHGKRPSTASVLERVRAESSGSPG